MRTMLHILLFLVISYCQFLVTKPFGIDAIWSSFPGITYFEVAVMVLILGILMSIIIRVKGKITLLSIGIIQLLSFGYFVYAFIQRFAFSDAVQEASLSLHYMKPAPRYVFGILICFYIIFFYQFIGSVRREREKALR